MTWCQSLGREEGFTIPEILIVLMVSSMLLSFGLSLFQFTGKFLDTWGRRNEIHSLVNGVTQRVALDIQRSRSVCEMTDSTLVLRHGLGKQVVYQFSKGGIWRNRVPVCEVVQNDLLVHLTTDPTDNVTVEIGTSDANALVRVSAPRSSKQHFEQSMKVRNAAGN